MKLSEMKKGQLLAASFLFDPPGHSTGFRVLQDPYKRDEEAFYRLKVENTKTGDQRTFGFSSLDDDLTNWKLVEQAPPTPTA